VQIAFDGALIVKVAGDEVTLAVVTVTLAVPEFAIRAAETGTVSLVALTKVTGVMGVAFQATVDPAVKLGPVMVNVNALPPAVAEFGLRLMVVEAGLIVKVAGAEVTPPVVTVTFTVPADAMRAAATGAVS